MAVIAALAALGLAVAAVASPSAWLHLLRRTLVPRGAADELAPALRGLAAELAAGRTLDRALARVGIGVGGAAGPAFARAAPRVARGEPVGRVLSGELKGDARAGYACAALDLHTASGGDLVRLLRGIATTLDERLRVDAEVRALTAQARLSAVVVPLLPLLGVLGLSLADPAGATTLFSTGAGLAIVGIALALDLAGAVLIGRISRRIR